MQFKVETTGPDPLNLRRLCEDHVNALWVPDHLTPEQAAWFAFDHFRRTLLMELELLVVSCE